MAKLFKQALAMAAAACGLLGAADASATSAVVFIHGTGDYDAGVSYQQFGTSASFDQMTYGSNSGACGTHSCGLWGMFSCSNSCWYNTGAASRDSYWSQGSIDAMRAGRNFLVVSYPGARVAPNQSWGYIIDQMAQYKNSVGITDWFFVTHSDGVNPVRYMANHSTMPSPTGSGNSFASVVGSGAHGFIFLAGSQKGTPLADIINSVVSVPVIGDIAGLILGPTGYVGAAVYFQQQSNMASENSNWDLGWTPDLTGGQAVNWLAGAPVFNVAGTAPSYYAFGGNCGSYSDALGLWTVSGLSSWSGYGGGPGGQTDGFIGANSSRFLGWNILSASDQLNHDESRHDCAGNGGTVSAYVNAYLGW